MTLLNAPTLSLRDGNLRPVSHTVGTVMAIADALGSEERLLGELIAIVRAQRDAVARDDIDALDDSVFATHRVLRTLGEARRQRLALNHLLGEGDDLSLQGLVDAFDGEPPELVRFAIDTLGVVASTLHREIDMNRRVLARVIDSGDQLVRTLAGVIEAPSGYTPAGSPSMGRTMFDRRI